VVAKIKLLAIVGPTASGKTALAIAIAAKYNGEIIAADSRTVYRYLDIGAAKPSIAEQNGVKHWGLDLVGPGQKMSVADFKSYADLKIAEIQARNRLPIIVGGSGLYVDSVLYDFKFAPANELLRQNLSSLSIEQLQAEITSQQLPMPENYKNKRYLIRTIERGKNQMVKKPLSKGVVMVGINPDKDVLRRRIVDRLQQMIGSGVLSEIGLAVEKYGWESEAMTAGIYRAFKPYINGEITLEEALSCAIASDLRLAKKQSTWFKRNNDIQWFTTPEKAYCWLDERLSSKL
jgi:tRNA dimethylallyltransferase